MKASFFPTPKFSKAKFEDFQKSEMIKSELIEDGFIHHLIFVSRKNHLIIIKNKREKLIKTTI